MIESNLELFNNAAATYDAQFTLSNIGILQRNRVYFFLEKAGFFKENKTVFEINCGTGYDAEQFFLKGHTVISTDGSSEMIKICKESRNAKIDFYQLTFQEIEKDKKLTQSDFLFSNFGGLNCLSHAEIKSFIETISSKQKSKDQLALVIIPKQCFWESVYLFVKGKWSKIGRRNTNAAVLVEVDGVNVPTYYHSPKEIKDLLEKDYEIKSLNPIAFFLPPSYLEPFFSKNKRFLNFLNNFEKLFGKWSALAKWSDHFIVIAQKR